MKQIKSLNEISNFGNYQFGRKELYAEVTIDCESPVIRIVSYATPIMVIEYGSHEMIWISFPKGRSSKTTIGHFNYILRDIGLSRKTVEARVDERYITIAGSTVFGLLTVFKRLQEIIWNQI